LASRIAALGFFILTYTVVVKTTNSKQSNTINVILNAVRDTNKKQLNA